MSLLPRRTRAAILVAQHRELVVDEIDLPATLDVGQVLVRVDRSGVCGSQIGEIDGVKGADPHLPHLLGHEGCGVVLAIGPGVRQVTVDDTVVLHWRKGAGIESTPPVYRWAGRRLNAGWVTTFNRYAVVSENRLTRIDAGTDPEIAALMGCPITTGLGIVRRQAQVDFADSVLVMGGGGVGLSVVLGAQLASAHPIVVVDRTDAKLALARELGATHTVRWCGAATRDAVQAALGACGADVVVDTTGDPSVISLAAGLATPRARIVLAGVPSGPVCLDTLPLHFGQRLVGSHGGDTDPAEDIPRYLTVTERGRTRFRRLVTDRYRLNDINQAIARLRSGEVAGRCLIDLSTE